MPKADLLARHSDLIANVISADYRLRQRLAQYTAHLLLFDGSNLRISEVWIGGELVKYSYYWLDEANQLIAGWDNAPHHPEIETHPHHLHTSGNVHESDVRDLEAVLSLLETKLLV